MISTVDTLNLLLSGGQSLLDRLRASYFSSRTEAGFNAAHFLSPFPLEIADYIKTVDRALEQGFRSASPRVDFKTASVSSSYQSGTNMEWGGCVNLMEAKLKALSGILKQADPDSMKPLNNPHAVFVVHGRSTYWNTAVTEYVQAIGLEPIILQDQPNLGQTLIEKFETHADVRFAIVLFTADDVGCLKDEAPHRLVARARQNVLLELGFFCGKIGRDAVCVLREPGVEIPTDLSGLVYTQLELSSNPKWQAELKREVVAAALSVVGGEAA